MSAPSGVTLPQAIADEYVLLRLAELLAAGDAAAALDRALDHHAGNGGAVALVELAARLRPVLADLEGQRAASQRDAEPEERIIGAALRRRISFHPLAGSSAFESGLRRRALPP